MAGTVDAIEAEFRRYKMLAESAMGQLEDGQLSKKGEGAGNSVATLARHLGGNLASRFTDFLTTDGEKPWRKREEEFAEREFDREELLDHWTRGWNRLFVTLEGLGDGQLSESVLIRGVSLRVDEALLRSLAHVSYHVGQLVALARDLAGDRWEFLSIPPGGSDAYNRDPTSERAGQHSARLGREAPG